MVVGRVELRTKNHCAGEDQQQFNSQTVVESREMRALELVAALSHETT
jgi:hypothetical protein